MYIIFVRDYENHICKAVETFSHVDEAYDRCETLACKFVREKEGEKRDFAEKGKLPRGFSVVKPTRSFCKFTIYHREKNGIIYAGRVRKMYSYFVVKNNLQYFSLHERFFQSELTGEDKLNFDNCLDELEMDNVEVEELSEEILIVAD